ncbi:MAG: hypothetical protein V4754_14680 [Pseudomonadota bacterium]
MKTTLIATALLLSTFAAMPASAIEQMSLSGSTAAFAELASWDQSGAMALPGAHTDDADNEAADLGAANKAAGLHQAHTGRNEFVMSNAVYRPQAGGFKSIGLSPSPAYVAASSRTQMDGDSSLPMTRLSLPSVTEIDLASLVLIGLGLLSLKRRGVQPNEKFSK